MVVYGKSDCGPCPVLKMATTRQIVPKMATSRQIVLKVATSRQIVLKMATTRQIGNNENVLFKMMMVFAFVLLK